MLHGGDRIASASSKDDIVYYGPFEHQDSSVQHAYGKGRGSLHCHVLFWFPNMKCRLVDQYLCSELSTYDPEVAVVTGRVQKSTVASKAPVREEASSPLEPSVATHS